MCRQTLNSNSMEIKALEMVARVVMQGLMDTYCFCASPEPIRSIILLSASKLLLHTQTNTEEQTNHYIIVNDYRLEAVQESEQFHSSPVAMKL